MRILLWHVHGSWMTSFVQGPHTYLLPATDPPSPDGLGRARTWNWPSSAVEVPLHKLRDEPFDVVILQRPRDYELVVACTGRLPGIDVPAVYVEHDTPRHAVPDTPHPFADHPELLIAHVTPFNDLFWDCGITPTTVIEHGIVDPGYRYSGERDSAGVVVNDPLRRGRVAGVDLLPGFADTIPLDLYGMRVSGLPAHLGIAQRCHAHEDLPQDAMHSELAHSRVYLHPYRWTSLGLALIEAMHLGMPITALATTEAYRTVPPEAGVVSTSLPELRDALARYRRDARLARDTGAAARQAAVERHGLKRFLENWNHVLDDVLEGRR